MKFCLIIHPEIYFLTVFPMCKKYFSAKLIKKFGESDRQMQARTKRQKDVFNYIKYYVEKYGSEPSYQLIARELGIRSKAGIARHIQALEAQGLLKRRRENGSFWLDLNEGNKLNQAVCEIEWLDVPRLETFVEEWENEPLFVPKFLVGLQEPERLRAFRVADEAMREKHICEGDVIFIEKRSHARDGTIAVALIDGKQAVLRIFARVGAHVELRAASEKFETIKLPANKIQIQGIFRGLLRPIS